MANFQLGSDKKAVNTRLKFALRNGTKRGVLKQVRGSVKGHITAIGSFKLAFPLTEPEIVEEAQFL